MATPGAVDIALARLFELAVVLGEYMEQGLLERGLTRVRATVLWQLARRGPITQRELAETLGVTPRNVTGLIDALEAGGFVTRTPHPADRRATLVRLSEQGGAVAAALDGEYRHGAQKIFGDIDDADLATFVETVDLVLDRLRQNTDRPAAPRRRN